MSFQVCLFEDGIQAVPLNWIEGDVCKYPPYINQIKINKAIANMEEPGENWIAHTIFRTFGHPTDNYNDAVKKAKLAEKFSDVDTDDQMPDKTKRKERAAKRLSFGDESEDEWLIDSPKPLSWGQKQKIQQEKKIDKRDVSNKLPKFPPPPGPSHHQEATKEPTRKSPRKHHSIVGAGEPTHMTCNTVCINETKSTTHRTTPTFHTPSDLRKSPRKSVSTSKASPEKDFKVEVLKKLNTLLHKVKRIEMKLEELTEGSKCVAEDYLNNETYVFPLKTKEEMGEFEKTCQTDPQHMQKCVNGLKSLDGNNAMEATVKILKRVITNDLAEKFSLLGRKKYGFKDSALYKVIFHTVRVCIPDTTEKDIDPIVARWLVQAKLRRTRSEKAREVLEPEMSE